MNKRKAQIRQLGQELEARIRAADKGADNSKQIQQVASELRMLHLKDKLKRLAPQYPTLRRKRSLGLLSNNSR